MAQYTRELFQPNNFNLAFEQMCNFAAIAKTRNADDTLTQLILQCFVVLPNEKFQNAKHLTDAITVFGLQIPEFQVQVSLNHLIADGRLQQSADSNLALPNGTRTHLKQRIDELRDLRIALEALAPSLTEMHELAGVPHRFATDLRDSGQKEVNPAAPVAVPRAG